MNKTYTTATVKKNAGFTCAYPTCSTVLSTYGDYSGGKLCQIHNTEESRSWLKKQLSSEKATAGKDIESKPIRHVGGLRFLFGGNFVASPYEIEKRYVAGLHGSPGEDDYRLVVSKGKELQAINFNREYDLFIRFAELPETEDAYLEFISKYGLLGLQYREAFLLDWKTTEEPLRFIQEFQRSFKKFYSEITDFIAGKPLDEQSLSQWFTWQFSLHVQYMFHDLSGRVTFFSQTLAGTLVMQLYHYLVARKILIFCELPNCELLTTRKKFCSDKHQKLFNTWKHRGKIKQKHGVYYKIDKPDRRQAQKKGKDDGKHQ